MSTKEADCLKLLDEETTRTLEENFRKISRRPDGPTLMLIAAEVGLSEEDTKRWFSQRYAQWRQAEGLPAEQGSVLD